MRLQQAVREKIDMYDRVILALRGTWPAPVDGHAPCGRSELELLDMVYFLEEERNRLRQELKELENGTHYIFSG